MKRFYSILFLLVCFGLMAQTKKRTALFLGNSYTYSNNMPQIVELMALSVGDTLVWDNNTPSGYPMGYHAGDPISLMKLQHGHWDYVILQDQSQFPAWQNYSFSTAIYMDSLVKTYNTCATTMFYMTWGRKNGDVYSPQWPYPSTYLGMDSLLRLNYLKMAELTKGEVSPAGAVWRYIREHHPEIELYQPDESHPSFLGSYAVACSFYTSIFRKDPTYITKNYKIPVEVADKIKMAAKVVVFDSLRKWQIGMYDSLKPEICQPKIETPGDINELVNVFPSPASNYIKLAMKLERAEEVQIFNAQGLLVMEASYLPFEAIDVSKLRAGIYFLRLVNQRDQRANFVKY